jgi:hypothetical protein
MKNMKSSPDGISTKDKTFHKKILNKIQKSFKTQLDILEEFLLAIGEGSENPKILKNEYLEGDVQLRCAYRNVPTKIYCLTYYKYDIEIYVKTNILPRLRQIAKQWDDDPTSRWFFLNNTIDLLSTPAAESIGVTALMNIQWDPDKIPRKTDKSDPWSTGEENRVFLGKGTYVEGRDQEIEKCIFLFQSMSEGLRKSIVDTLGRNKIGSISIHISGNISASISEKCLSESKRPLAMVFDVMDLLVKMARELENSETLITTGIAAGDAPLDIINADEKNKIVIATCNYCTSKFLLTEKFSCPNCGASYR